MGLGNKKKKIHRDRTDNWLKNVFQIVPELHFSRFTMLWLNPPHIFACFLASAAQFPLWLCTLEPALIGTVMIN